MEWFIGFFDAEGNFQRTVEKRVTKRGDIYYKIAYSFHISLSLVDKELLYEIKDFLGMGRIYLYPKRNEAHFSVYRVKELQQLVNLLSNYNFLTRNQSDNFRLLQWGLYRNIKRAKSLEEIDILFQRPIYAINYKESKEYLRYKEIFMQKNLTMNRGLFSESFFPNWISGFMTGEASFTSNKKNKSYNCNLEQVDKNVLEFLKAFFEFNPKVYTKKLRKGRQQSYCIEVSSKKDLTTLIDFIENKHSKSSFITLKGNKRKQFRVWLELFNKKHQETK
uniref:Putative LAGLIDADG homing endonuclease n=1 Tax=Bulbochaete rectangularis var. hiloensis TaxID=55990 RepID=A0A6M4SNZ6_9CHLO|nr:putative LAGLIDADG homing endonuclease [Bulbochaete rectangularis var. hiloensis]